MTDGPIVPRWEWRCFGEGFRSVQDTLSERMPDRVDDSNETYVLSAKSDASVKVRDHLLDVKHLEQLENELELWRPVLKAAFPLSAEDVAVVLDALGAEVAPAAFATFQDFAGGMIEPDSALLALPVHKRRTHYTIDDCMVEYTELEAGGRSIHTVAVEAPDANLVQRTLHALGLDHRANVNMARGLKALVGFGIHRVAIIDIGTNSVKYLVADRDEEHMRVVADSAVVTRLGEGLDEHHVLGAEPVERTVDVIADIVRRAQTGAATMVVAVGTAGLRAASNRDDFLSAMQERVGLRPDVLSGDEEARLAYRAATATVPVADDTFVVFDTGGGSSQFSFGRRTEVEERFSLDVGAVRVTERFALAGAVTVEAIAATLHALAIELAPLRDRPTPVTLIGMGGTATNIAAVQLGLATYDADAVHGLALEVEEIDRQIELYRTRDAGQRRSVIGLQPARAEVILAGALILRTIVTQLGHTAFVVSDRGLRHGILAERFAS